MRRNLVVLFGALSLLLPSLTASAASTPNPEKEWTFLVYLNGNNNLDSFGSVNLEQMEKVGSTDKINVVVQWASLANGKTQRLLVQKSTNPSAVTSPILADIGQVDMGDYRTLVDFVQWGVQQYPAKHYLIDVWDHGSGWHNFQSKLSMMGDRAKAKYHATDISWDENTGHFITTVQLGQALAESAKIIGHKVDLYGSDACLMAMAEVATEVSDSVEVYAGSEETEPGAGWPYDALLTRWSALATASAQDVATILVQEYVNSYNNGENGSGDVTFSAFDLSKTEVLQSAITDFAAKIQTLDAAGRTNLLTAASAATSFTFADYVDLGDFVSGVSDSRAIDPAVVDNVRQAVSQFVIANADTSKFAKAKGMSIWLPTTLDGYTQYADAYSGLKWEPLTHWGDALKSLLQTTR
jgi:hypothetical protein